MKEASNHAEEFVLVGLQHRLENLALCLSCTFMWIYSESYDSEENDVYTKVWRVMHIVHQSII